MWARCHAGERKSTTSAVPPQKKARPSVTIDECTSPPMPPSPQLPYCIVSPPNGLHQCEHALGACGHLSQKFERARVGVGGPKSKMSSRYTIM